MSDPAIPATEREWQERLRQHCIAQIRRADAAEREAERLKRELAAAKLEIGRLMALTRKNK